MPPIEAARIRLRPILMTSFAFILGVLPLVFASGAGSQSRHSVGTTVFGGMIVSTVLNLFFIPVLYVIVKSMLEREAGAGQRESPVGRTLEQSGGAPLHRLRNSVMTSSKGPPQVYMQLLHFDPDELAFSRRRDLP